MKNWQDDVSRYKRQADFIAYGAFVLLGALGALMMAVILVALFIK